MSAEKSHDLQLADSTVVKIISTNNNNYVMITFSYDNNRSKVRYCVTSGDFGLKTPYFRLISRRNWSTRFLYMGKVGPRATPMDR